MQRTRIIGCVVGVLASTSGLRAYQDTGIPAAPPHKAVLRSWTLMAGVRPRAGVYLMGLTGGSFLGVDVCEVDRTRMRSLNLKEERGVEITHVQDGSPAGRAGLKAGDVVVEFAGQRVEGTEQFVRLVHETPPGREIKAAVSRQGATINLTVTMGIRKPAVALPEGHDWHFEMPTVVIPDVPRANMSWRSSFLGIEAEAVDSQLAEFFGAREGVLVRSVQQGSPAEKAGLKAGDVIVRIDNTDVATPREITVAIRSIKSKRSFALTFLRDKRETTINLAIDEDQSGNRDAVPPKARSASAPDQ